MEGLTQGHRDIFVIVVTTLLRFLTQSFMVETGIQWLNLYKRNSPTGVTEDSGTICD